jgi:hypothetical protein
MAVVSQPFDRSAVCPAPGKPDAALGDQSQVDTLTVEWPSGVTHELRSIPADRHIIVDEATGQWETVTPGKTIAPAVATTR